MTETPADSTLLPLAAKIVSAYAANNEVKPGTISFVIRAVYEALSTIESAPAAVPAPRPAPFVPIRKSVFPDYIICLEDGKRLKMLKRHLAASYNLTPGEYREKWGLDVSYPMVAPNYAERRSELAKQIGLGIRRSSSR